ncbi:MAG: PfkB family carbohydrate kinase [Planctomycetaceae bacterium]|jgi:sugar/nucleoside kinase (ribokinase family)|nr:PfkB family carbohydrate kinase [Planctomycetaceae bacterium]
MSLGLTVVGSIAIDSIQTPLAKRENILGGSAIFAAYAASLFVPVQMVGVVGEDWSAEHTKLFQQRGIDTEGIEIEKGGKTFRWFGKYLDNMNDRETLDVQLNVLGKFKPKLPESYRQTKYLFLGNGAPSTGLEALDQIHKAELVVADTMDLWINIARSDLDELIRRIDGLVLNDSEAKQLTGEINTLSAGRKILDFGLKFVVVKKGEHGAIFFSRDGLYVVPAFPTEEVVDPTGAGDSFAGAMFAYIVSENGKLDERTIKNALVYGTLVASFCVEGFSIESMEKLTSAVIESRLAQFKKITAF